MKFPDLEVKYNLKSRRDYLDNRFYVDGVKHKGTMVIPALDDETKQYLNDFNKEYYGDSFDSAWEYDGIHKILVDKDTIDDLKDQIRVLKKERKKVFGKSPNTTTEDDRNLARHYTTQIEEIEAFIYEVHPRREMDDMNNDRNMDLLNYAKRSNQYDLVSWDTLEDTDLIGAGLDDKDEDWEDGY